jgi:signal transduction histidine kinase
MQSSARVEVLAGASMLVVCLLIGGVEASSVQATATRAYFAGWLLTFVVFIVSLSRAAAMAGPSRTPARRLLLVGPPLLAAGALVLLSASRGGMVAILLVLTTAVCAYHLDVRGLTVVIVGNSAFIAAAAAGLGPLVDQPARTSEILLVAVLYTLLQAGSAAAVWSQQRVEAALEEVSAAHVALRSTSALLAESSQAQERLRISRDLHDVLGHQLAALALELEIASHRVEGAAEEHVLRARGLAKELLGDVRAVVGKERRRYFDLESALVGIVAEVPRPQVRLDVDPDLAVDDDRAVALVRIVQEVTTNAIRHSAAAHLWIRLIGDAGRVCLEAWDDGVGVPRGVIVPGNGLRGLTERVAEIDGTVEIDGSSGFRVRVELPARQAMPA